MSVKVLTPMTCERRGLVSSCLLEAGAARGEWEWGWDGSRELAGTGDVKLWVRLL